MLGLKWNAPYYKNDETLPFVPTEKEVDALISGCTKKNLNHSATSQRNGDANRRSMEVKVDRP